MGEQTLDFGTVWAAWSELLAGAGLTLQLTVEAIVLGMAIAIPAAWAKTAGPVPLRRAVGAYVEVIRNTPFLLQLYFFFFGLPSLGVRLAPNQAALLTMVINLGAYATEIVRAGLEAVPHGQTEAGSRARAAASAGVSAGRAAADSAGGLSALGRAVHHGAVGLLDHLGNLGQRADPRRPTCCSPSRSARSRPIWW